MTSKMPVEGISCYQAEAGKGETKLLILFKERGNEGMYLSPEENSSYKQCLRSPGEATWVVIRLIAFLDECITSYRPAYADVCIDFSTVFTDQ